METLRAFAKNWMPLLFNAFLGTEPGQRGAIARTLSAYACVCDPAFLTSLFHTVLKKLLKVPPALLVQIRLKPLCARLLSVRLHKCGLPRTDLSQPRSGAIKGSRAVTPWPAFAGLLELCITGVLLRESGDQPAARSPVRAQEVKEEGRRQISFQRLGGWRTDKDPISSKVMDLSILSRRPNVMCDCACAQVTQDAAADVPPPDAVTEGGGSPSERRCAFLELALALAPGLAPPSLDMLYRSAKPALQVPCSSLSCRLSAGTRDGSA